MRESIHAVKSEVLTDDMQTKTKAKLETHVSLSALTYSKTTIHS
jgi:hypothetical protein